jgi:ankyrin repeat protein
MRYELLVTALMYAARSGNREVVSRLLDSGAEVSARNVQEWSALDFARLADKPEAEALLRAHGATALLSRSTRAGTLTSVARPATAPDPYAGWKDVHVAAARADASLLKSLLARGADANARNSAGVPVLIVAASQALSNQSRRCSPRALTRMARMRMATPR